MKAAGARFTFFGYFLAESESGAVFQAALVLRRLRKPGHAPNGGGAALLACRTCQGEVIYE
jgi:hypothetical protein